MCINSRRIADIEKICQVCQIDPPMCLDWFIKYFSSLEFLTSMGQFRHAYDETWWSCMKLHTFTMEDLGIPRV